MIASRDFRSQKRVKNRNNENVGEELKEGLAGFSRVVFLLSGFVSNLQ
jgi:hypothetical protein